MEHEIFETIVLDGKTIDVGGGANATYLPALAAFDAIDSVNIDPSIAPTLIVDLNGPLPIADGVYDNAICFNTLEHIENDRLALGELMRVLKEDGRFHIIIPFLYQVHAAPSDFHRHTHYEWDRRLVELGLDPVNFSIQPMVWDPVSSAYSILESAVPRLRWLLRPLCLLPGLLYYKLRRPSHGWAALALGYYITGQKRSVPATKQP